jgi:hypothetical protein
MPVSDEAKYEYMGWDNRLDELEETKKEMKEEETEQMKMRAELTGNPDKEPPK